MTPQPIEKTKSEIKNYLHDLLKIMQEEEVSFEVEGESLDDVYVNLTGTVFSIPEERPALRALGYLLRVHLHHKVGVDCNVVLDINGTVKRRRAALIRFALTTAESVREEHKRVRLNPMPSQERKTIHIALSDFPGVRTYSVDEKDQRRVVIEPEET